jgi:hypothetical protein
MATTDTARVFISHATQDKPFVRRLVSELERHNLHVWFDEREIKVGDSIVTKITEGLNDSPYLAVVISKASIESRWVREELNAALMDQLSKGGSLVLPILIDDCALPPLLRSRRYADFRSDFQTGLQSLLAVFEQEGETAAGLGVPIYTTKSGTRTCLKVLSVLSLADLRRRVTKRMNRAEVGAVWYDVIERKMDDDMAGRVLADCVIELIDYAKNRNKLQDLINSICAERVDLMDP